MYDMIKADLDTLREKEMHAQNLYAEASKETRPYCL